MNRDLHSIVIDPEFQALIPPLSADERSILEASIKAEGVRDALRVWNRKGESVLLDGHNRHAIATTLGILPAVEAVPGIETRDDAIVWIIRNQLGRRNLSDFSRVELAERMGAALKARAKENMVKGGKAGADMTNRGLSNRSNPVAPLDTRDEIAKAAGVGTTTVERVRTIKKRGIPELQDAVRSGQVSSNAGACIASLPEDEQRSVVASGPAVVRTRATEIRRGVPRHDSNPEPVPDSAPSSNRPGRSKSDAPKPPETKEAAAAPAPEPVRSPSERPVTEATKARDAKVKDMLDQGMSAREIAKEIGCERGAVYQAKSRIVGAAAPSHLNHVRDQADGFATALSVAIEVGERKWSGATREQRMAAVDALKRLNKTTRKLIAAIESAEEGGSQC